MSPAALTFASRLLLAAAPAPSPADRGPTSEPASASTPTSASDPTAPSSAPASVPAPAPSDDTAARLEKLESEVGSLRAKVEDLETENTELREEQEFAYEEREALHERIDRSWKKRIAFGGYLDVGLFWVEGNGAGIRHDQGHEHFPEYATQGGSDTWIFFGDPLSTAVNARGEPADLGESEAVKFDSIDSCGGSSASCSTKGKSSFLVNAVNFTTRVGLGEQVVVFAMADLVPRGRDVSTDGTFLGDFVDLKLAYVMWRPPVRRFDLELYAGKIDSVFGREYRIQESPRRTEVTPSLICRYTCGRPVGVSTRMRFLDRAVSLAAALTNGSSYQESFAFYNEIDRNLAKTASGRLAYLMPWANLELGVSGQIGAQDLQADDAILQHQYGFDAHVDARGFELTAEFVQGRAHGKDASRPQDCQLEACLDVMGAYGTVGYRALNWLLPFVRVDWRDAFHRSGTDFLYISKGLRVSPGARFEITPNFMIKAQYSVNLELTEDPDTGRYERIPNDVLTSAIVAHF